MLSPALAAGGDVPPARTHSSLEEIVVTARRREERLQDVPVAVTALNLSALSMRQITDVSALARAAPGLEIEPVQSNRTTALIGMRGQTEVDLVPTMDPAVGLFLDGVYIARATGANLRLVDMERVEVLRGPQGTLFGRNTIGGAINLVPSRPTWGNEGRLEVGIGNYGARDAEAMVNVPVFDGRAAVRFAGLHSYHDGYARAVDLHRDLGDGSTDFVSGTMRVAPSEAWDINLAVDWTQIDEGNQWVTMLYAREPEATSTRRERSPKDNLGELRRAVCRETQASHVGGFDERVRGASLIVKWTQPGWSLESITAYRDLDLDIQTRISTALRMTSARRFVSSSASDNSARKFSSRAWRVERDLDRGLYISTRMRLCADGRTVMPCRPTA